MDRISRKFSPCEQKSLDFAKIKHEGMTRIGGQSYIKHPIAVAAYLYDHGYRGKYTMTAFFHDLLEDTDTTEEEIFKLGGRFTRDAVKLLTKRKGTDIVAYLDKIESNEVAYAVKVADRIDNLRDACRAGLKFQKKYLKETEDYYLDFAVGSPFFKDLYEAFIQLRYDYMVNSAKKLEKMPKPTGFENPTVNDKFEIIIRKVREVDAFYDVCDIYINGERFIDMIKRDESKQGYPKSICGWYVGLSARDVLLPYNRVFIDNKTDFLVEDDGRVRTLACGGCGMDECATLLVRIEANDDQVIWSEIGKNTGEVGPFTFNRQQYEKALDFGYVSYLSAYCYANGIRVKKNMTMMRKMYILALQHDHEQAKDYIWSINSLYDETKKVKDKSFDASEGVIRYWICDYGDGHNSALKIEISPTQNEMTFYNSSHKNGKIVEGDYYFKIALGREFDYETVSEEKFLKFIKSISKIVANQSTK